MQIDPNNYDGFYNVLKAMVVPRPIAFISSVSKAGDINLAPYSFFNAVCYDPPTIIVSIQRLTPDKPKDTLANIEATGEFVINVVTQDIAQAMNMTSAEYPGDMNEFDIAGLTQIPSTIVKAPRVKESPINMECSLNQVVEIGPPGKSYGLVVAEVRLAHIRRDHPKRFCQLRDHQPPIGPGGDARTRAVNEKYRMPRPLIVVIGIEFPGLNGPGNFGIVIAHKHCSYFGVLLANSRCEPMTTEPMRISTNIVRISILKRRMPISSPPLNGR